MQESLGSIKILQATQCSLNGVTTAMATLNDQSSVEVTVAYDANIDALIINVAAKTGGVQLSLYDLASIALS